MLKKYFANIKLAWAQLRFGWRNASWFYRFDLLCNAILFGDPQETISSRCGKYLRNGGRGAVHVLCRVLSFIDPARGNHCIESIQPREGADEIIRLDVLLVLIALCSGAWWLL